MVIAIEFYKEFRLYRSISCSVRGLYFFSGKQSRLYSITLRTISSTESRTIIFLPDDVVIIVSGVDSINSINSAFIIIFVLFKRVTDIIMPSFLLNTTSTVASFLPNKKIFPEILKFQNNIPINVNNFFGIIKVKYAQSASLYQYFPSYTKRKIPPINRGDFFYVKIHTDRLLQ